MRLRVFAFGLNRSEYHSVAGLAEGMTYPRVLGIEATGVVDLDPDGITVCFTGMLSDAWTIDRVEGVNLPGEELQRVLDLMHFGKLVGLTAAGQPA